MNYNIRPKPRLIDPSLLGRVNKVYVGRANENNAILEWLYNTIYPYFRDNFFFTLVVVLLVGYLLYRYFENVKKKNKIKQNINNESSISVKLDKPINYSEKFNNSPKADEINLSEISEITNLSSPKNMVFEKDVERDLQMGDKTDRELNRLPPEQVRQHIAQQNLNMPMGNQINMPMGNQMNIPMGNQMNMPGMNMNNMMPNMGPSALQQNMSQINNMSQGCANYKTTSLFEPKPLNEFSDNYMDYNLL
jgi:hypothetical protein